MNQEYTPVGPSSPPPVEPPGSQGYAPTGPSNRRRYLLFGCGGCAVIAVLVVIFGGWAMVKLGLDVFAGAVTADLRDNPVIIEHIGRIEELEVELQASLSTEGQDDFVFRVRGTKGSGLINATCVTNDDGVEEVVAGTIQLDSGETLDLFPDVPPEPPPEPEE
jgi:hypothetical protein